MTSLRKNSFILFAGVFALSGCADYLNNRDTVTLGAGNAVEANLGIHTIDPFPPDAKNTDIEIDGRKTEGAYKRYVEPCDPDVVKCRPAGQQPASITINATPQAQAAN